MRSPIKSFIDTQVISHSSYTGLGGPSLAHEQPSSQWANKKESNALTKQVLAL